MSTTTELREMLGHLSSEAASDLVRFWRHLSPENAYADLMDVIPGLLNTYGDASAAIAAEWYDQYRAAHAIAGGFAADVPKAVPRGAEALAGWGAKLLGDPDADSDAVLTRITGGLQRRITDSGRDTIAYNSFRDPQAQGWQREAEPGACGFCVMLSSRAVLYRSEDTAAFGAHDDCGCGAVPSFGGERKPVRAYTPSERVATDADRARARAWIKANL
jgi:hypothetical protein